MNVNCSELHTVKRKEKGKLICLYAHTVRKRFETFKRRKKFIYTLQKNVSSQRPLTQ